MLILPMTLISCPDWLFGCLIGWLIALLAALTSQRCSLLMNLTVLGSVWLCRNAIVSSRTCHYYASLTLEHSVYRQRQLWVSMA